MALPTQPFRDEHAALLDHIEHIRQVAEALRPRIGRRTRGDAGADPRLPSRKTLVPHARAEEEVLYPEWSRLNGSPDAMAPMVGDHRAPAEDPADLEHLRELLYGLYVRSASIFRKEKDIQLPTFDASPVVAARVVQRMGAHERHQH